MSRPSSLWFRKQTGYWCTTIDGKQVRLDQNKTKAKTKLQALLRGTPDAPTLPGMTIGSLADRFLENSQAENEKETFELHQLFLQSFCDHVGKRRLTSRLCEADLDQWCRKQDTWGENTCVRAKAIVLACLNYGVRKLNLPLHPLKHVRPGSVGSREHYLTPDERQKIRAAISGSFADYVAALEQTGARPFSEVAKVTAADVDLDNGTWTLAKWKNSRKKKGIKRVIYLTEPMVLLTKKLMLKYPEGPLFRNSCGDPWTRQTLTARFRKLGKRLGIPGLSAYLIRHCYISDALARGVPVAVIAELCGTSIQTIERHYNKLHNKHDVLREAARQAVG